MRARLTKFAEISADDFDALVSASSAAGTLIDGSDSGGGGGGDGDDDDGGVIDDTQARHFFRLTLTRDNNAQLSAAMSVAPDYPTQAPRFVLWNSTPSAAPSTSVSDAALRQLSEPDALRASDEAARGVVANIEVLRAMEAELCRINAADGVGAPDELLARQMRRLVELWEIAQEVAVRGDAFGDGGKFCTRAHRGRDRRPPFAFSSELQVFTHQAGGEQ
jgi:hypothetical protein